MGWKWDTTSFTLDSTGYTLDGAEPSDVWRWDTTHFTLDSTTHTMDGWHDDGAVAETNQRGTWYGFQQRRAHLERLRDEDAVLLAVIKEFLGKAA